jgi:hypothetical protein
MKDRPNLDDTVEVRDRSVRDTVDDTERDTMRDTKRNTSTRDTTRDTTTGETTTGESDSFLPQDRMEDLRERWDDIQAGFVDDPRNSVQKAHGLVSALVNELNETFTRERSGLESQWNRGEDADTENLRVALQRYRGFFNRLLR